MKKLPGAEAVAVPRYAAISGRPRLSAQKGSLFLMNRRHV